MENKDKQIYVAPAVKMVSLRVEHGFQASLFPQGNGNNSSYAGEAMDVQDGTNGTTNWNTGWN